ncbi:signal peptidase I [bacterium]|nr:signal peptidase I [bacterium]
MAKSRARVRNDRIREISFSSQRIRADGRSSCEVRIKLAPGSAEHFDLRLTAGSFAPDQTVREVSLQPDNDEVAFRIYSPRIPRSGFLLGEGLKAPLQFSPANFTQYLAFDLIPTLFFAVVFALIIRSFAVASFYIPSGSMEPTLLESDRLIADRLSYTFHLREPQRGDIIIFRYPDDPRVDYIKRVIALPGETVEIHNRQVFVNGEPLSEDYTAEAPRYDMPPRKVPDGKYFVLGDNRNRSRDSHIWGFVPEANLVGEALFIYWPLNRVSLIRNPYQQGTG